MSNLHDFLYQRVQALEAHVELLQGLEAEATKENKLLKEELNALYSQLSEGIK
jgi:hypothetical protein